MNKDDENREEIKFLRPEFQKQARAAVERLRETIRTNKNRMACGHPAVYCQLTGEEVLTIHDLFMGLNIALIAAQAKVKAQPEGGEA